MLFRSNRVKQVGEARRHATDFLQSGAWAAPEGDTAIVEPLELGPSAMVWRLTWSGRGSHARPYQLSIGTIGNRLFPLAGFPAPALREFARGARLSAADTGSARAAARGLVAAMTLTTCGGPVLPTVEPLAGPATPVVQAWREARQSGVVDTMWMSYWLGDPWSRRDAAGNLYVRFPALRCVADGLWGVDQWALVFSRDGELADWVVREGDEFVVP